VISPPRFERRGGSVKRERYIRTAQHPGIDGRERMRNLEC
jgi:hypothetical protein